MLNVVHPDSPAKQPRRLSAQETREVEIARLERWIDERVSASQSEPLVEMVTLSPALATVLLRRNEANRPISAVGLERLKRDISEGRWLFNGEGIVVSRDGKLNDGQHRCRAVIETERSIRMVIAFGPDRESRLTLDQGVARTVGHYLGMHGHSDPNNLGVVANYVWQYKTRNRLGSGGGDRPTKTQALQMAYNDAASVCDFVSQTSADKFGVGSDGQLVKKIAEQIALIIRAKAQAAETVLRPRQ